jgi:menaquinone C8-methyltransferase
MIYERLLLPYFRRQSRRAMNFDAGEPGMPTPPRDGAAFLYVHVPFCPVLCPFCSFHRVKFREDKAERYFGALRREIEAYRDAGFRFTGVYVGGGTPTVVPAELVQTLQLIRDSFPVKEVSVETNPSDLTDEVLSQLVDAGVDRLSVGVQSFDDNLLREMERYEKYGSSAEILARLDAAAGRFPTLNVDMIFNLPHQTPAVLDADLATVQACGANQVSFYPLMTSDAVKKKMTARMGRLDRGRVRQYYERILERLQPEFRASSAWCFTRGGQGIDEYIVEAGDYVGIGSGAFSYVNGTMYSATFSLNAYADRLGRGLPAITRSRRMSLKDQMRYDLLVRLFGLRLDDDWLERRYGRSFFWRLAPEMTALNLLGAVRRDRRGWQLTERGMYLWVLMMSAFFESVNVFREGMRHNIRAELDAD